MSRRKVTAGELIALINRRVARYTRRIAEDDITPDEVDEANAIRSELQFILGRCTAHNESIRSIGKRGD